VILTVISVITRYAVCIPARSLPWFNPLWCSYFRTGEPPGCCGRCGAQSVRSWCCLLGTGNSIDAVIFLTTPARKR
jgi:hypothetical protein